MSNVMAAQPNTASTVCESSIIPFLIPPRKIWLMATVRSIGCQTGLYNPFDNRLAVYTIQPVVKAVVNRFDNRLYRVNGALHGAYAMHRPIGYKRKLKVMQTW